MKWCAFRAVMLIVCTAQPKPASVTGGSLAASSAAARVASTRAERGPDGFAEQTQTCACNVVLGLSRGLLVKLSSSCTSRPRLQRRKA
eukprot:1399722-Rhodomonas_salina.1